MSGKPAKRPKHVPQRTCVGCRTVQPKRTLIRLVRRPEGVQIDPTGKLAGRGAYLHNLRPCWEKGLRGPLAHALKATLTPEDLERLQQFSTSLPEAEDATGQDR
ncbi:MAG: YlxR family protein [Anaerolineales bacterium]|nr:YlxR family protein [Anaerolineales bacterium]